MPPAVPHEHELGLLLSVAFGSTEAHYYHYRDLVTGQRGRRPFFCTVIDNSIDSPAYRGHGTLLQSQHDAAGVFVGGHLPDCAAYRTRPGSIRLPRDDYAEALADSVAAAALDARVRAGLTHGWLVLATEKADPRAPSDQAALTALAERLADHFEPRAQRLPPAQQPAVEVPQGNRIAQLAVEHSIRGGRLEAAAVPVERKDLPPGSEAARVHVRRRFGPEDDTALWIGLPGRGTRTTVGFGCHLDHRTRRFLRDDAQLLADRLVALMGSNADAVRDVVPDRWEADSAGAKYSTVTGRDDPEGASEGRVVAAARALATAGNDVFGSPGLAYLERYGLGNGVVLELETLSKSARNHGDATISSQPIEGVGDTSVNLLIAWATRAKPGSAVLADVGGDPPAVTVPVRDDAEFAALLVPVLERHAAAVAPSRWVVTPDLLIASGFESTGWVRRRFRRDRLRSDGPSRRRLAAALEEINRSAGSGAPA